MHTSPNRGIQFLLPLSLLHSAIVQVSIKETSCQLSYFMPNYPMGMSSNLYCILNAFLTLINYQILLIQPGVSMGTFIGCGTTLLVSHLVVTVWTLFTTLAAVERPG